MEAPTCTVGPSRPIERQQRPEHVPCLARGHGNPVGRRAHDDPAEHEDPAPLPARTGDAEAARLPGWKAERAKEHES